MNPRRLRSDRQSEAMFLWLAAKRADCPRDIRRLLHKKLLCVYQRGDAAQLAWARFDAVTRRKGPSNGRCFYHMARVCEELPWRWLDYMNYPDWYRRSPKRIK